ncbi:sigma factor-like helix-turn-helix DNA-binding protein [Sedimenticola sp.]
MLTLERLSPAERAAFILHDVFRYGFDEIGQMLDKSAPACRKLASRARDNIQRKTQPNSADRRELEQLSSAFFDAIRQGDMDLTRTWFNGVPGYVLSLKQNPVTAFSFDADQGLIGKIYAIRNPDKLRYFV